MPPSYHRNIDYRTSSYTDNYIYDGAVCDNDVNYSVFLPISNAVDYVVSLSNDNHDVDYVQNYDDMSLYVHHYHDDNYDHDTAWRLVG